MRLLVTSHPGWGHLLPALAVAARARAAGHEVLVATGPRFAAAVRARGLAFASAGPDWSQSEQVDPPPWLVIARDAPPRFARDLLALAREWRPDLILREETEVAGWIVADAVGIPSATLGLGGNMLPPAFGPDAPERYGRLRAEAGAPPDPELAGMSRYLYLDPYPPGWVPPGRRADGVHHPIGVGPAPAGTGAAAARAAGLEPAPEIYATLGTVHHREPGLLDAFVAALGEVGLPSLVTVGPGVDAALPEPPRNVRIEGFVPQDAVLPGCRIALSHAGSGTTLGALRHGVPQLLVPIAANQGWTAELAERAGVARRLLGKDPTPPGPMGRRADLATIGAEDVRAAVEAVLADDAMRARAREDGATLRRLWEAGTAVRLLERLAETRRPVRESPAT